MKLLVIVALLVLLVTSVAASPEAPVVFRDDFDTGLSSAWEILRPDPSLYSVHDGLLDITCSPGNSNFTLEDSNNIFLIPTPAPENDTWYSENYSLTMKVTQFVPQVDPATPGNPSIGLLLTDANYPLQSYFKYSYGMDDDFAGSNGTFGPSCIYGRFYDSYRNHGGRRYGFGPSTFYMRLTKWSATGCVYVSWDGSTFYQLENWPLTWVGKAGFAATGDLLGANRALIDWVELREAVSNVYAAGYPGTRGLEVENGQYSALSVSVNSVVGLRTDGSAVMWGADRIAPIGDGPYAAIANGGGYCIFLEPDGTLSGWGGDWAGQISDIPTTGQYKAIAAGSGIAAAITQDGVLRVWGHHPTITYFGLVSDAPAGPVKAVSIGSGSICLAILEDGTLYQWGNRQNTTELPPAGTFKAISCGYAHCVAIRTDGTLAAWGWNNRGQCDVPEGKFVSVSAGENHNAGFREDGTLVTWGSNYPYIWARPETNYLYIPPGKYSAVAAGRDITLAIKAPANSAPVSAGDVYEVDEDTPLTVGAPGVLGNDSDPDGDPLQAVLLTPPAHGVIDLLPDGSLNYTPEANYNGPDSFTYAADDDKDVRSEPATVSITVLPVNDPPVLLADSGQVSVAEGEVAAATGTWSDVEGDIITLAATAGQAAVGPNGTWTWSFQATDGPGQTQPVTITADDGNSGSGAATFLLKVNNLPPTAALLGPTPGLVCRVGQPIKATGWFSDPGTGDTHTAEFRLASATATQTQAGAVTETAGNGSVCADITVPEAGVYSIEMVVTDKDGASATAATIGGLPAMLVVYDPDGGFVTGGGWINSPSGAYCPDPALAGKASFGFVAKYRKGAAVPEGQTEFVFSVGKFRFRSSSYDWLVVAGAKAQFKGTGDVNGSGGYGFMLTAVDGQLIGGGNYDKFRIRIWDKVTGSVVYDNQPGNDDSALENGTILGGGSVVIHKE